MKKNLFWIVIPTVCLLSLVAWFLATSSMSKDFKTQTNDINQAWTKMRNIGSMEDIPNKATSDAMQLNITKRRDIVAKAWDTKVKAQTGGNAEERILVWPQELGEAFVAQVEKLYPIEKTVAYGGAEILDAQSRQEYRDYITLELPKLARRIGAEWKKDARESSSPEEGSRDDEAEGPVVYWNGKNQEEIENAHFNWSGSNRVNQYPSTLEVLYAQEDLWVLSALMDIIADVNTDATGPITSHRKANIREISLIHIGKKVGERAGEIEEKIGGEPQQPQKTSSGSSGSPDSLDPNAGPDPAEGRYVDSNYEPLSASVLRDTSNMARAEAYLAVAKRIPIRMRLRMDQRKINDLLAACGNSKLMVEVRQVRINRKPGSQVTSGGGGGGLFGGHGGGGHGGSGGGSKGVDAPNDKNFPWDVYVEIYGIIFIYNPPDGTLLEYEDGKVPPQDQLDARIQKYRIEEGKEPEVIEPEPAEPEVTEPTEPPAVPAEPGTTDGTTQPPADGS